jgi:hypothetical protein
MDWEMPSSETQYQLRHTAATKVRREIQKSQFRPALRAA